MRVVIQYNILLKLVSGLLRKNLNAVFFSPMIITNTMYDAAPWITQ